MGIRDLHRAVLDEPEIVYLITCTVLIGPQNVFCWKLQLQEILQACLWMTTTGGSCNDFIGMFFGDSHPIRFGVSIRQPPSIENHSCVVLLPLAILLPLASF